MNRYSPYGNPLESFIVMESFVGAFHIGIEAVGIHDIVVEQGLHIFDLGLLINLFGFGHIAIFHGIKTSI